MWWCDICEKELKSKGTHKFTQKHLENEEKKGSSQTFLCQSCKEFIPVTKRKIHYGLKRLTDSGYNLDCSVIKEGRALQTFAVASWIEQNKPKNSINFDKMIMRYVLNPLLLP